MDREVKVRIDLLLDNQASLFDTLKQLNQLADRYEEKIKRLHNLQGSGAYQIILEKEIDLLRKKNQYQRELQTANTPLANAQRQLDFENQIYQIQRKRDQDAIARQAHYQARYGRLGVVMSAADRLTMSGFGYAAASGTMLGMAGSAGGTAVGTFTGALQRAAGEIGLMFVPAIMSAANLLHSFSRWVRDMNPTLKTTIGYLATYGLAISAGAKVFTIAMSGLSSLSTAFTAAAARIGVGSAISGGSAVAGGATVGLVGKAGAAAGGAAAVALPFGAVPTLAGLAQILAPIYSTYRYINAPQEQRDREGLYGFSLLTQMGENAVARLMGWDARHDIGARWGPGEAAKRDRAPLSIPGYQSQQIDIFSLKDMIQQESLRDPNEQEKFGLAVREFQEAVRVWMTGMDPNRPAGIFDWLLG